MMKYDEDDTKWNIGLVISSGFLWFKNKNFNISFILKYLNKFQV